MWIQLLLFHSAWRTSLIISYRAGLPVTHSLSFYLTGNVFTFCSFLKDNFAAFLKFLVDNLSFTALDMSFHSLWPPWFLMRNQLIFWGVLTYDTLLFFLWFSRVSIFGFQQFDDGVSEYEFVLYFYFIKLLRCIDSCFFIKFGKILTTISSNTLFVPFPSLPFWDSFLGLRLDNINWFIFKLTDYFSYLLKTLLSPSNKF